MKKLLRNRFSFQTLSNLYLFAIILISVAIAPNLTSDPFNTLKVSILIASSIFFSFSIFSLFLIKEVFWKNKELFFIFLFPINLILVVIFSDASKIQQIYGVFGRRTGLLTYISLFLFFLITIAFGKYLKLNRIIITFFALGIITGIYGLLQPYGLFRIESLASKNLQPFGFFGNTNFQSAFLGFTMLLSFADFGIKIYKKNYFKYLLIFARLIILSALLRSESQQGLIIVLSGFLVYLILYFYVRRNYTKFLFTSVFTVFAFSVFVLGVFNFGPLASIIFQDSVQARVYYWSAALRIIQSSPVQGIGLDSYGDWWWKYRDTGAVNFLGENSFTTSAHNIFLDIGTGGGVPLILSFLILNLTIFLVSLRIIKRMLTVNRNVLIIISVWIAFQIFNLISINHVGVGIWFWIFSGVLINIYLNIDHKIFIHQHTMLNKLRIPSAIFVIFLVVVPILRESNSFERIRNSNNPNDLITYYKTYNMFSNNLLYVSYKLKTLGDEASSLEANRILTNKFPNFYDGWNLLTFQSGANSEEKDQALQELKRLDPKSQDKLSKLNQ